MADKLNNDNNTTYEQIKQWSKSIRTWNRVEIIDLLTYEQEIRQMKSNIIILISRKLHTTLKFIKN